VRTHAIGQAHDRPVTQGGKQAPQRRFDPQRAWGQPFFTGAVPTNIESDRGEKLFMQALDLSRYRHRQRDDALGAEDRGVGPFDQPCATVLRAPRIRRLARKDVNGLRFQGQAAKTQSMRKPDHSSSKPKWRSNWKSRLWRKTSSFPRGSWSQGP